jgi:hypothetical protein
MNNDPSTFRIRIPKPQRYAWGRRANRYVSPVSPDPPYGGTRRRKRRSKKTRRRARR